MSTDASIDSSPEAGTPSVGAGGNSTGGFADSGPGAGGASASGSQGGADSSVGGRLTEGAGGSGGSPDASTSPSHDAGGNGGASGNGGAGGTGGLPDDASVDAAGGNDVDANAEAGPVDAEIVADSQAPGPVAWRAYWSFDELVGDRFIDQTGHKFDVTILDTTVTTTAGISASAVQLTGLGEGQGEKTCAAQAPAGTLDTYQDFSVSVWVSFDDTRPGKFETILSKDGAQNSAFFLQKRPALSSGGEDSLAFVIYRGDKVDANDRCPVMANVNPKVGHWYHVVGTYSAQSGRTRVYVDGVLAGERPCSCITSNGPLQIGRGKWINSDMPWTSYRDYFPGRIDEVGVIDVELTPAQVAAVYATRLPAAEHTYVFGYATISDTDGMRLAASHDGVLWLPLRNKAPVLTPLSTAGQTLLRAPDLKRDPHGVFHALWASSSGGSESPSGSLGHAESVDMLNWVKKAAVQVVDVHTDAGLVSVSAPESIYDEGSSKHMVYWSSQDQGTSTSSVYYSMTADFATFEPSKRLLAPGYSIADPTIVKVGAGSYAMFFRDDSTTTPAIRVATSTSLPGDGHWTPQSVALNLAAGASFQGPTVVSLGGAWVLFVEQSGTYTAYSSTDLTTWTAFPIAMPSGAHHGTVIDLPNPVYGELLQNLAVGM